MAITRLKGLEEDPLFRQVAVRSESLLAECGGEFKFNLALPGGRGSVSRETCREPVGEDHLLCSVPRGTSAVACPSSMK